MQKHGELYLFGKRRKLRENGRFNPPQWQDKLRSGELQAGSRRLQGGHSIGYCWFTQSLTEMQLKSSVFVIPQVDISNVRGRRFCHRLSHLLWIVLLLSLPLSVTVFICFPFLSSFVQLSILQSTLLRTLSQPPENKRFSLLQQCLRAKRAVLQSSHRGLDCTGLHDKAQ